MATTVKIELQMDESGAVTGFRSLDAAATKVQTTFKAVALSGTQMGEQVAAGANKAGAAIHGVGEHALTSLDSVRLFRDEFGIHIPRSMEKAMASSKLVMGMLNSMQGVMLAVGGVGVFLALGKQIYDVGREIFKTDDAVLVFNQHLAETAHNKFMDTASIEDVRDQIRGATSDLAAYDAKLANMPKSKAELIGQKSEDKYGRLLSLSPGAGFAINAGRAFFDDSREEADQQRNQAQKDADTLAMRDEDQRHKQRLANIEIESKRAAEMENPAARAIAEDRIARERSGEDQYHTRQDEVMTATIANRTRDKAHQMQVDPNAGAEDRTTADALADADRDQKLVAYARERQDELRRLDREGNNASLRGYQLMEAQKAQALDDFVRKYGASREAEDAINRRYNAEEKRASDELTAELARNKRDAMLAGLTGIPEIEARSRDRDAAITDELNADKFAAAGDRAAQEAAANQERLANKTRTDEEIKAEDKRFHDEIDALADASTEKQVQGFARIRAEGEKQLDQLRQKFDQVYGGIADKTSPEYLKGLAELDRGRAAINQGTNSQVAQLAQKNADETAKIEAEAYRSSLPAMKQHQQEILDTYSERTEQYRRMLQDQEISQEDFNRRTAAAAQQMNAQLAADSKAQRDRIAQELEPFLSAHPLEALEKFGAKQAAEIGAGYIQKLSGGRDWAGMDGKGKKSRSLVDWVGTHPHTQAGSEAAAAVQSLTMNATTVNLYARSITGTGPGGVGVGVAGSGGGAGVQGGAVSTGLTAATSSPALRAMAAGSSAAALTSTAGQQRTFAASSSTTDGSATGSPAGDYGMVSAPDDSSWTGGAGVTGAGAAGVPTVRSVEIGGAGQAALNDTNKSLSAGKDALNLGKQLGVGTAEISKMTGLSQKALGNIGGAIGAGAGLFSAFEGNGGAGGALTGAMSGAQLGGMLGPEGAAIGAGVGAVVGLVGFGGVQKAEKYDRQQVRPHIEATELAFEMGSMPYEDAYSDIEQLSIEAKKATKAWGPAAKRYFEGHMEKEFGDAIAKLTREQKAGRSQYGMTAAQFDSGGQILGFGDYATGPDSGWIHAKKYETVMHQGATETHGDALALMLAGATRRQMAEHYNGPREMAASYTAANRNAAFGAGHTVTNNYGHTIHAIDAAGVAQVLMNNKHSVRGALNASYAENSGGADIV